MKEGVVAVIGPLQYQAVKSLQWILSARHIPFIVPLVSAARPTTIFKKPSFDFLRSMVPSNNIIAGALSSIFKHYNWKSAALLGSNTDFGNIS